MLEAYAARRAPPQNFLFLSSWLKIGGKSLWIRPWSLRIYVARRITITVSHNPILRRNFLRILFRCFLTIKVRIFRYFREASPIYRAALCDWRLLFVPCWVTNFVDCYANTREMRYTIVSWHCTSVHCSLLVVFILTVQETDCGSIEPHRPSGVLNSRGATLRWKAQIACPNKRDRTLSLINRMHSHLVIFHYTNVCYLLAPTMLKYEHVLGSQFSGKCQVSTLTEWLKGIV